MTLTGYMWRIDGLGRLISDIRLQISDMQIFEVPTIANRKSISQIAYHLNVISKKDFIHKMSVIPKELKSLICLTIIESNAAI
jgi:hypothetical protein